MNILRKCIELEISTNLCAELLLDFWLRSMCFNFRRVYFVDCCHIGSVPSPACTQCALVYICKGGMLHMNAVDRYTRCWVYASKTSEFQLMNEYTIKLIIYWIFLLTVVCADLVSDRVIGPFLGGIASKVHSQSQAGIQILTVRIQRKHKPA